MRAIGNKANKLYRKMVIFSSQELKTMNVMRLELDLFGKQCETQLSFDDYINLPYKPDLTKTYHRPISPNPLGFLSLREFDHPPKVYGSTTRHFTVSRRYHLRR